MTQMLTCRIKHPGRRSGGVSFALLLGVVVVGGGIGAGLWYWQPWKAKENIATTVLLQPVKHDLFIYEVTEQGEIESSRNVEVACEVQGKNSGGTTIIEIVPEGTVVKTGDFLVRLDSSALKEQLSQQQITCNTSEAGVIQAENTLKTAQINRQEYLEGTFKQEEQLILSEKSVADENLRRSTDFLQHSEKLAAKGYVTSLQLEADKFAVEKAKMDLETAKTKLNVLRNYTRAKMLSQFEADIKIAEANVKSQKNTHELDLDKLNYIQEQIKKCEIHAPADGQVVYANKSDRRGSTDVIIEAGSMVRERQVIIRLPDTKHMQVKAKVNESRIDRIRTGQPAIIRLDAFPDAALTGTITRVDDYPLPGSWFTSSVKEYGTIIEIDSPPPGTRPGMTAEVKIRVEEIPDALQVPVQAVVERGGHHFALVQAAGKIEAREIAVGSTNDKFVVVKNGLSADQQVIINPQKHLDSVVLPALPPVENRDNQMLAQRRRSSAAAEKSASSGGGKTETTLALATSTQPNSPAGSQSAEGSSTASAQPGDRSQRKRRGGGPGGAGGMDPSAIVGMILQRMDKNGDSKIAKDEAEGRMADGFSTSDANGDGFIDRDELLSAMARRMASGGGPGGGAVAAPNAGF